jgi:hypothetical protein
MVGTVGKVTETSREKKGSDWDMSNHAVDCRSTERKRLTERIDNSTNVEHNVTQFKSNDLPDVRSSGME